MKYRIKMHLGYIFYISFILSQQLAWGNADRITPQQATSQLLPTVSPALQKADEGEIKKSIIKVSYSQSRRVQRSNTQYTTGSCVNRCHVDYMTYQTMYQEEFFRHRVHSPKQGMECSLCHKNYVDDTKPHGSLIIQNNDCITCHHKEVSNEDCLKCHAEVKEYMDGWVKDMITKIPDWMSKVVSCNDCHKLELDGSLFKPVRNYCIECHSPGYGVMYDLWKEILDKELKQFSENERNILNEASQIQTHSSCTILLAEQINVVAQYLFDDSFVSPLLQEGKVERANKSQKKRFLQLDVTNRHNLLRFVRSYGMHNILLSQILLKSMGKGQ